MTLILFKINAILKAKGGKNEDENLKLYLQSRVGILYNAILFIVHRVN